MSLSERIARKRRWRWPASLWITALVATLAMPVLGAPDVASAQTVSDTWQEEDSVLSPPLGRTTPAMIADVARGEIVLFGGHDGSDFRADTWTWDGATWTPRCGTSGLPACGPSPRMGAAIAIDPGSGNPMIFGGYDGTRMNDVWVWTGATWVNKPHLTGSKPSARYGASMVFDPTRERVVLFGGNATSGADETWLWNGATWTRDTTPGTPPANRWYASAAYDPANQEVVIFGGFWSGSVVRGDTFTYNSATGQWAPAGSNPPSARYAAAATYDPVRRGVILFGGWDGTTPTGDTWLWDGDDWAEQSPLDSPSARAYGLLAVDPATSRPLLFGGFDGTNYFNDTWTLQTEVETPDPGELLDEVPDLSIDPYPSTNDPSCQGADNLLRGYVGDAFVQVRTGPDAGGGTAVCVAADDGATHLGGKLVLNGAPGAPVETDEEAEACAADPGNERVQSGLLLGQPYALDVTPLPEPTADAAWVCVQVAGMGVRLVVTTAGAAEGTRFEPDNPAPFPPGGYAEEGWPVADQPSSFCKDTPGGTKTRVVNLRVGESDRLALYLRRSGSATDVCYRGLASPRFAGARLTAEAAVAVPGVVFHGVDGNCPFPVLTRDEAPTFGIWTDETSVEPDGTVLFPNSVCVEVAGFEEGVSITFSNEAGVGVQEDEA